MSNRRTALILLLLCCLLGTGSPGSAHRFAIRLQGPTFVIETPVTSNGIDPRNETSIAVSAKNDQIIVGVSKLIDGGGGNPRGNTRVAYYYSSDGGRTWGNNVLTLETPQ